MQTKPFDDLSLDVSAKRVEDVFIDGPIELDMETLGFVSGGSPRGGWLTAVVADTTASPRGGWL